MIASGPQRTEPPAAVPFPDCHAAQAPPQLLRWHKRLSVRRYVRLLERVAQMSPAEIGTRLWLKAHKGLRALSHRDQGRWVGVGRGGVGEDEAEPSHEAFFERLGPDLHAALTARLDQHFFFGPSQRAEMCDRMLTVAPAWGERVRRAADALRQPGTVLLGQRVRLVPGEIDWQADPGTQRRQWPTGVLDEGEAVRTTAADVKYVWEINRQQFLPLLGRAYWLTGETRYARDAADLVADWLAQNPVGLGVN